jgi:hypothetical protein
MSATLFPRESQVIHTRYEPTPVGLCFLGLF